MSVSPFPVAVIPQGFDQELRHSVSTARSSFTGATWKVARQGSHFAFRYQYRNLQGQKAAVILAAVAAARGGANSFYLLVPGYTRRGSGFGSELFSNGTFASGTTGWSAHSSAVLTASDYVIRATAPQGGAQHGFRQSVTLAQYVPYVVRSILHVGRGSTGLTLFSQVSANAAGTVANADTGLGLNAPSIVSIEAAGALQYPLIFFDPSGYVAGDYAECSFASMSRCALVDNGSNLLLQSDEFDTTWTTGNASVDDQALTAPDGTSNADHIAEDGAAASEHYVSQSVTVASAAGDFSLCAFVKPVNRSWVSLGMIENVGSHQARAWFNVTTGALGTAGAVGGANWTNVRSYIAAAGNGWYYCCLVARKASAGTNISNVISVADADFSLTFNGLSQNSLGLWRATLAQSSVPTRPIGTTAAATSGTSQTGGTLHLKGLPVSTSGILLAGDYVQIPGIDQLVRVRSALNSDAAGLGYLQFEPILRASPADSAAVIDVTPLARMMMDEPSIMVTHRPGGFVDVDFTAVEDIAA